MTSKDLIKNLIRINDSTLSERGRVFDDCSGHLYDKPERVVISVDSVRDIPDEFITNSQNQKEVDFILPKLPSKVSSEIGSGNKGVRVKHNIFYKNAKNHSNLTADKSKSILQAALYSTKHKEIYQGQGIRYSNRYWVSADIGNSGSALVVLDANPKKSEVEVVGWRWQEKRKYERSKEKAVNEGASVIEIKEVEL